MLRASRICSALLGGREGLLQKPQQQSMANQACSTWLPLLCCLGADAPYAAQVIVPMYYVGFTSCLAEYFAGCMVLPTLARQELQTTSAAVLQVT